MASVFQSTGSTVIDRRGILGTDGVCNNSLLHFHMILEGITKAKNKHHLLDTTGDESWRA